MRATNKIRFLSVLLCIMSLSPSTLMAQQKRKYPFVDGIASTVTADGEIVVAVKSDQDTRVETYAIRDDRLLTLAATDVDIGGVPVGMQWFGKGRGFTASIISRHRPSAECVFERTAKGFEPVFNIDAQNRYSDIAVDAPISVYEVTENTLAICDLLKKKRTDIAIPGDRIRELSLSADGAIGAVLVEFGSEEIRLVRFSTLTGETTEIWKGRQYERPLTNGPQFEISADRRFCYFTDGKNWHLILDFEMPTPIVSVLAQDDFTPSLSDRLPVSSC